MFNLIILTPEKTVYKDLVHSVAAPGADGYFEILKDHAPFLSTLQQGKLTITDKHSKKIRYTLTGGLLEVSANACTLLADTITPL